MDSKALSQGKSPICCHCDSPKAEKQSSGLNRIAPTLWVGTAALPRRPPAAGSSQ